MLKLMTAFLAGALALAGFPALAVDLPDTGSKNFNPSDFTPAYFANETAPVSARTADTTERDWSAVDAAAPARPAPERAGAAHRHRGGHGKYAAVQRSGRYAGGKSAGATPRAAVVHTARQTRNMSRAPVRIANARSAPAGAVKPTSGKHGKPGARHAGAAVVQPVM